MIKTPFYARQILPKLKKYFLQPETVAITGMRRVGKTTLLKYLFGQTQSTNKLFWDLEDVLIRKIFQQDNYQDIKLVLEEEGLDFSKPVYIFLDEVQLAPNIVSVIKYFFDHYRVKFVVSGSSSFYFKHHFTESLAGRKFLVELHPLIFQEFLVFKGLKKKSYSTWVQKSGQKSQVEQSRYQQLYWEYVKYGGFPQVVLTKDTTLKKARLREIVSSYFQLDVATLADFSDTASLRDLLLLLTQRVGQKVNVSNLANTLGISRQRVYDYVEFLEATYVVRLISQKSSLDNQVSSQDKVYFSDTGLARILGEIDQGSQFENSVMMNLGYESDVTYYQTKSGGEIDFVVDKKVGLEVKQTATAQNLSILRKRLQSAGLEQGYVVTLNQNLQAKRLAQTIAAWNL